MIKKQENIDWINNNEETMLGQLILYISHVDLAHLVLHPEKWDDAVVDKIRLRLEKSEGLIKVEKQKRKKAAAKKPPVKVQETDDEADSRLKKEMATETEEMIAAKDSQRWSDCDLPDDDYKPNFDDNDENPFVDFE
jgi:hypothetical protein